MTGYKRFRISADTWPIQKPKEKQSSRNWETQQEVGKTLFISLPPPSAAAEEATAEEAAATSAAAPSVWVKGDQNWNMKTNKASNPVDGSQLLQQKPSGNSALKREKSPAKGEGQADRHIFRFAKHLNFDFQRHLAASKRERGSKSSRTCFCSISQAHEACLGYFLSSICDLSLAPRAPVPFCPLAYL